MKLNDLKKAEAKALQDLQAAERKASDLQQKARTAKARSEQARLEHKRARKSAKQAKKLAAAAVEQAHERTRVLKKVEKRLAKALKKAGQGGEGKQKGKRVRPSPVVRPSAAASPVPKKQASIASRNQEPAAKLPSSSAAAGDITPPPVSPTA